MFEPSNMLKKYMNAEPRDIYDIVGALIGYINADPSFKTNDFDQAIKYVLDNGVTRKELFAEFDPEIEYEPDPTKWNEEYYSFARVYLKDNFSEKRIKHVKEVARKLHPIPKADIDTKNAMERKVENKNSEVNARKKPQGQRIKEEQVIIQKHRNVKIVVLIAIVAFVLLTLAIVSIIHFK